MSNFKKNIKSIPRVVLYLRLSDEDQDKLSDEQLSESIINQEKMLRDFSYENGWKIVGIYNDDDWSGSDVSRPGFNKMIDECRCGNVDIVLCKTQARFARDMELIEKYIHNLFHEWNVRFMTVVDKIDNYKAETKKTSQILGLTDEWYLEDTSLNIRETFRTKRKNGELTASFTTYGFIKDPENKNHLIIDPIASLVVKRIYEEYYFGSSILKIVSLLNKEQVLSPYEYKLINGCNLKIPLIKEYINYSFISKTGTYILDVNFTNKENYILKDFISFNYITTDMKEFNNKCYIVLRKYTNKKIKIYYSEKDNLDINNFMINDYILLKENDLLPKNTTVIAVFIKELDRTHTIHYQFEITLKENRLHEKYFINIRHNNNKILHSSFIYNIRKKFKWCSQTIKKILTDEVYIGNLVQFKTTTVSYKNHTVIYNDKDEMIRCNNTHEAIIDKNIWIAVQNRLTKKSRSCKNGSYHIFSNKIYCTNCKQIFFKCGKSKTNGFSYLCCKDKKNKWSNCDNKKYLLEEDLHNFVLDKVNCLLNKFYDSNYLRKMYLKMIENDLYKDRFDSLEEELQVINKRLHSKSEYFQQLYNDYKKGIIPQREFLILVNKYSDETLLLEERERIIREEIVLINNKRNNLKTNINVLEKYKYINKLSNEIVNCFIDKILIGNYDSKNNSREIKIIWNFIV